MSSPTLVVVTGANGFIGRNLISRLRYVEGLELRTIDRSDSDFLIGEKVKGADVVFHLAGVNRPENEEDFQIVNVGFTKMLVEHLERQAKPYRLVFTSSSQAGLNNPYGHSKLNAEQLLKSEVANGQSIIYRLPGVFGKWCRPNYNSVVATFCHNAAHGLPLLVRDKQIKLDLVYIDDVVESFLKLIGKTGLKTGIGYKEIEKVYSTTLGFIAEKISSFKNLREAFFLPNVSDDFEKALYSTFLSYLPTDAFATKALLRTDSRGSLYEIVKSRLAGQIFVSTTLPGVTRGNHFHHLKTEKFLVIEGEGIISFRRVDTNEKIDYKVSGKDPMIVDIPPGYTHNITNVGKDVMVTLFWANEIFDQNRPDTFSATV